MENNFTLLGNDSVSSSVCSFNVEDAELDLEFLEKKKYMQWIAYRIIGPGVVGIGLLGNLLNLLVLTRPSLKGVTYTYLIGLACSDIGVLLCAIPMMIRQSRFERESSYLVTFFYAHLEYPLANSFMASSIFIVLCLTLDRFSSVCLPTRFKEFHTSTHSKRAMSSAAILALLVSAPLALINTICPGDRRGQEDAFTFVENYPVTGEPIWRVFIYFEECMVRFGPATVLAILNFLIILRFRIITTRRREMLAGGVELDSGNSTLLLRGERISKKIYKEEKRLVTLLSAIVLLFFVTTTPVAILGISYSQSLDRNLYFQLFRAIANVLELCNFALNFYVYFLCSKEFRKKFLSFFTILLPLNSSGGQGQKARVPSRKPGEGGGNGNHNNHLHPPHPPQSQSIPLPELSHGPNPGEQNHGLLVTTPLQQTSSLIPGAGGSGGRVDAL